MKLLPPLYCSMSILQFLSNLLLQDPPPMILLFLSGVLQQAPAFSNPSCAPGRRGAAQLGMPAAGQGGPVAARKTNTAGETEV